MIDMELPKDYHFGYESILGLNWEIDWTDIVYSAIDLNMDDVKFELTQPTEQWEHGLVRFDFPALKHWELTA